MDYINSYIDEWKRLRTDEEMFKEFLKNLTPESFMEFIMKINKDLRRDDDEEIISEGVIAGELVATTKSVREEIIKQLVDYLKQEPNMKEAATLIYNLAKVMDENSEKINDLLNYKIDNVKKSK